MSDGNRGNKNRPELIGPVEPSHRKTIRWWRNQWRIAKTITPKEWLQGLLPGALVSMGFILLVEQVSLFKEYRAQHVMEREEVAKDAADHQAQSITVECRGFFFPKCTTQLPPAEAADKAAQYDLRAQQEMAEWAFGVFLVSVISAAISAVGLWALWRNISLLREQIHSDKEIGQKQVRAYLSVEEASCQIERFEPVGPSDWSVRLGVEVRNAGQSPARNVGMGASGLIEFGPHALKFRSELTGMPDIPANTTEATILFCKFDDNGAAEEALKGRFVMPEARIIVTIGGSGRDVFKQPLDYEDSAFISGLATKDLPIDALIDLKRHRIQGKWAPKQN